MRKLLTGTVLVAATVASLAVAAQPAQASSLAIEAQCESGNPAGMYQSKFFCFRTVTGAVGSFSVNWQGLSNAVFTSPTLPTGKCSHGGSRRAALVRATVTDSAGNTATTDHPFFCYAMAP